MITSKKTKRIKIYKYISIIVVTTILLIFFVDKKVEEKNKHKKTIDDCRNKLFYSYVDNAEKKTQNRQFIKALELYKKAYGICPDKNLEEQIAWLMNEIGYEFSNKEDK